MSTSPSIFLRARPRQNDRSASHARCGQTRPDKQHISPKRTAGSCRKPPVDSSLRSLGAAKKHKAAEVVVSFMPMLGRIGPTACDGPAENPEENTRPTP
jgi:hypothetical protein